MNNVPKKVNEASSVLLEWKTIVSQKPKNKSLCKITEKHSALLRLLKFQKAEIIDITSFNSFEDNNVLKVIDQRLTGPTELILSNPYIIRKVEAELLNLSMKILADCANIFQKKWKHYIKKWTCFYQKLKKKDS